MVYRDTTYCASPNCTNQCGRKMSDSDMLITQREEIPVCFAYFCDVPEKKNNSGKKSYATEEFTDYAARCEEEPCGNEADISADGRQPFEQ